MEPTGKLRWLKDPVTGELTLQQQFLQPTLERAVKIWIDVPIVVAEPK